MAATLRHPDFGYEVEVVDEARREVFLARGYTPVEAAPPVEPPTPPVEPPAQPPAASKGAAEPKSD